MVGYPALSAFEGPEIFSLSSPPSPPSNCSTRGNNMHRLIAIVIALGLAAHAQAGKTLTLSQATREDWNDIGRKLIAMAEDFPEDKYDFKPTPAQRSFAEQLLHVAGS